MLVELLWGVLLSDTSFISFWRSSYPDCKQSRGEEKVKSRFSEYIHCLALTYHHSLLSPTDSQDTMQTQAADQNQVMERELRMAQRELQDLRQEKDLWLREQVG